MLGRSLSSGIVLLALSCAALSPLNAAQESAQAQDIARDHLVAISASLRCMVCKGETLYNSQTELAQDLRSEIHVMLEQGQSDQQIRDILLRRYGDSLLHEAPRTAKPFWWGVTFGVLLLAGAGVLLYLRSRKNP